MSETHDGQEYPQDDQIPAGRSLPGLPLWVPPSTSRFTQLWMREVLTQMLARLVQMAALSLLLQEGLGTPRVLRPKHVTPDTPHQQFLDVWTQVMLRPGILRHTNWSEAWDIASAVNEAESGDVLIIPVEGLQEVVQQMLDAQGKKNIFLLVQPPLNLLVRFTAGPYDGKLGLLKHFWGMRAYVLVNEEYVGWVSIRDFDIEGTSSNSGPPDGVSGVDGL